MVSSRCILKVKTELAQLGIADANIELGWVELTKPAAREQIDKLRNALSHSGLEVMRNKNQELVEQIKFVIRQMIDEPVDDPDDQAITNSEYISEKLGKNYTYLAKVFADKTGMSIGQFIISHRIEHAKVLIRQDVLSLSDIAFRLNYSSIGHLSNQFKQVTGISPSVYRRISRSGLRRSLPNGRLMGHQAPHTFSASLTETRLKRNFTENQISINKI